MYFVCASYAIKNYIYIYFHPPPPWRSGPTCVMAYSFLKFLDDTTTHNSRQDSSGRVISSSQWPLPENTKHSQQTNIYDPGGIRTKNHRQASGRKPTP
jgi:hypothetical protein